MHISSPMNTTRDQQVRHVPCTSSPRNQTIGLATDDPSLPTERIATGHAYWSSIYPTATDQSISLDVVGHAAPFLALRS